MKKRRYLYASEAQFLGIEKLNKPQQGKRKSRYYVTDEDYKKVTDARTEGIKDKPFDLTAWTDEGKIMTIDEFCSFHGLNRGDIKNWRLCTHTKVPTYNISFKENEDLSSDSVLNVIEKSIESILSRNKGIKNLIKVKDLKSNKKALKVTTSDDHVGLEPDPKGNGLFKYEYNANVYKKSYDKVFQSVIKEYNTHGLFDLLLLDNLGDEQDGWNGFTTRGGHELPQNMSNAEVFETCVDVKVSFIRSLIDSKVSKRIILRKVVNDNHSGDFGHTINLTVKKIINLLYSEDVVKVETLSRFMEHRVYGDHCFILTHGKDAKQMFKGLPLQLNDKTINFVNDYIKFYDIKSKYVHLEKGDLHQIGFNKCNTFDYRNFMSFAPPSSWVQHNFGDCYSGYSIQVIPKNDNEISHTDYFIDYVKKVDN